METKDENNKVREPELAYGQRRKTTIPLEEIVRKYPWLKDYPGRVGGLDDSPALYP